PDALRRAIGSRLKDYTRRSAWCRRSAAKSWVRASSAGEGGATTGAGAKAARSSGSDGGMGPSSPARRRAARKKARGRGQRPPRRGRVGRVALAHSGGNPMLRLRLCLLAVLLCLAGAALTPGQGAKWDDKDKAAKKADYKQRGIREE